jgi:hypothetical protein
MMSGALVVFWRYMLLLAAVFSFTFAALATRGFEKERIVRAAPSFSWADTYVWAALVPWHAWALAALAAAGVLAWHESVSLRRRASALFRNKAAYVAAGWGFWASTSWLFDNLLYPAVIAWLGLAAGGATMTAAAMAITFFMLIGYERSRTDWLGMDAIDETKDKGLAWVERWERKRYGDGIVTFLAKVLLLVPKELFKAAAWMLEKGGMFAFVVLSVQTDPFITTAYFRRGRTDGLNRKDWTLFFLSGLLSNVYWSLRSYGVVVVIRYFWRLVH